MRPLDGDHRFTRVLHIITRLIIGWAQEGTLLSVEGLDRMPEFEVTLATGLDRGPEGDLLDRTRRTTRLEIIPELGREISLMARMSTHSPERWSVESTWIDCLLRRAD